MAGEHPEVVLAVSKFYTIRVQRTYVILEHSCGEVVLCKGKFMCVTVFYSRPRGRFLVTGGSATAYAETSIQLLEESQLVCLVFLIEPVAVGKYVVRKVKEVPKVVKIPVVSAPLCLTV